MKSKAPRDAFTSSLWSQIVPGHVHESGGGVAAHAKEKMSHFVRHQMTEEHRLEQSVAASQSLRAMSEDDRYVPKAAVLGHEGETERVRVEIKAGRFRPS